MCAKIFVFDNVLAEVIKKQQEKLREIGCRNPSASNSLRSLLEMEHISAKGKNDTCNSERKTSPPLFSRKIPDGQNGKEVALDDGGRGVDFSQTVGYEKKKEAKK
jgi:hypothetical protein